MSDKTPKTNRLADKKRDLENAGKLVDFIDSLNLTYKQQLGALNAAMAVIKRDTSTYQSVNPYSAPRQQPKEKKEKKAPPKKKPENAAWENTEVYLKGIARREKAVFDLKAVPDTNPKARIDLQDKLRKIESSLKRNKSLFQQAFRGKYPCNEAEYSTYDHSSSDETYEEEEEGERHSKEE